jgi:S-adenosylmethionine/arginine decarboxylase-like enzyme
MILKHRHLIIRAEGSFAHDTEEQLTDWMTGLVDHLQMKLLIKPQSVFLDVEGNRGWTSICAIETSSITFHSWTEHFPYLTQLDIYSCKEFDLMETLRKIQKDFKTSKLDYKFIDRDKNLEEFAGGFLTKY